MEKDSALTVLIVDDEHDVARFLSMALEDAGFNVITASNGVEGIEKLKQQTPDLVSLDVVMPGGSGLKMHREMRKNDAWAKIPVLVVTGHARDDLGKSDFNEMTMSGPGVYLEKPVTAEKYIGAVKKILGISDDSDSPDSPSLKNEVKSLLDSSDPETIKEVMRVIKSRKKE